MGVVTAQMVKELRQATLAGMSDCKKALDAAEGDIQKAQVFLREKGLASAAKKSDRAAKEGIVSAVVNNHTYGYLFELNCETDFVTKSDAFQEFVSNVENVLIKKEPNTLDELLSLTLDDSRTVQESCLSLVATVGENIKFSRCERLGSGSGFVASYVHAGGRIATLVELSMDNFSEQQDNYSVLKEISHNVALQAAAMKPLYLSEKSIPDSVIKTEEEIIRNKFLKLGKPEAALAKIIPSSLKSWFKETCLVDQPFVKDDTLSIAAYVQQSGKSAGISNLAVHSFVRVELGK